MGSNTYKVKRYECLFTTQVRKKRESPRLPCCLISTSTHASLSFQRRPFMTVSTAPRQSEAVTHPVCCTLGFIRHHHFNSRAFLLSEDGGELSTTFYRSPAGGPTSLFENDFVLGGEVEFEDGYLVEVGQLVWEGETVSLLLTSARARAEISCYRTSTISTLPPVKHARRPLAKHSPGLAPKIWWRPVPLFPLTWSRTVKAPCEASSSLAPRPTA